MWNGKLKAITFSYDDGVTQDLRLAKMFHKYDLKATFNLNYELLGKHRILLRDGVHITHYKLDPRDVPFVYEGHEIAAHTLTFPLCPRSRTMRRSSDRSRRTVSSSPSLRATRSWALPIPVAASTTMSA